MLRSDLCDYSDAYVELTANVDIVVNRVNQNNIDMYDKQFILKNNEPFVSCITKINWQLVEKAEDLDVVMPMYNLIEYSKSYRKTKGSLHNYYRDEPNSSVAGGINFSLQDSASFDYKAKIMPDVPDYVVDAANPNHRVPLNSSIIVLLKHLGNFWHGLDMPLINCEVELILKWNKNSVLVNKATRAAAGAISCY